MATRADRHVIFTIATFLWQAVEVSVRVDELDPRATAALLPLQCD